MIEIVPVPELIFQYEGENQLEADPLLYAYFRDEVFLKEFSSYLIKRGHSKNKTTSDLRWFSSLKNLDVLLSRFKKYYDPYIIYNGKYYVYSIMSTEWLAIQLYQFEEEDEAKQFLNENIKTSTSLIQRILAIFTR